MSQPQSPTPEQALAFLDQVAAQAPLPRGGHVQVQEAGALISKALERLRTLEAAAAQKPAEQAAP